MPSTLKAQRAIAVLLPDIKGPVYELGSGWGHLLWILTKRYSSQPIIGIESSWIPYLFSKALFSFFPKENLSIKREDFFETPLESASLVVCYLYPGAMEKLKGKFEKELQPGSIVITNTFAIPHWTPERETVLKDLYQTKIYLYRVPE